MVVSRFDSLSGTIRNTNQLQKEIMAETQANTTLQGILDASTPSPLFSTYGMSTTGYDNEGRTIDALLWTIRHVPKFAESFPGLGEVEESVTTYSRPTLTYNGKRPTPDALVINKDRTLLIEAKIGSNKIDLDQCVQYQQAADAYEISHMVTISNEPKVFLPNGVVVTHTHLSWSYVVVEAEWLAYELEDEDQVEILTEFVRYARSEKVGISANPLPIWYSTWKQALVVEDSQDREVLMAAVRSLRH